jgi:hypothetical protein
MDQPSSPSLCEERKREGGDWVGKQASEPAADKPPGNFRTSPWIWGGYSWEVFLDAGRPLRNLVFLVRLSVTPQSRQVDELLTYYSGANIRAPCSSTWLRRVLASARGLAGPRPSLSRWQLNRTHGSSTPTYRDRVSAPPERMGAPPVRSGWVWVIRTYGTSPERRTRYDRGQSAGGWRLVLRATATHNSRDACLVYVWL